MSEQRRLMPRLWVLGGLNVDLVVRGVASLPRVGETVVGGRFERHHGGKGGNQAVAAARVLRGTPRERAVVMIGAVGDDELGRAAMAALEAESVDRSFVELRAWESTGVALIVVDETGENQIAVAPGANGLTDPGRLVSALAPSDVLLASLEVAPATVVEAARAARSVGARFVLNPAPAGAVPSVALELADVLVANESELEQLLELDPGLLDRKRPQLAITRGPRGVRLVEHGVATDIAARPVQAVDATGAGDTFAGVLAAGLLEGRPFRAAAVRANLAAALSVTRSGARPGMPDAARLAAADDQ